MVERMYQARDECLSVMDRDRYIIGMLDDDDDDDDHDVRWRMIMIMMLRYLLEAGLLHRRLGL